MTNHPGPDFTQPFATNSMPVGTFAHNVIPVPALVPAARRRIDWEVVQGGLLGAVLGLAVVVPLLWLLASVLGQV